MSRACDGVIKMRNRSVMVVEIENNENIQKKGN